MSGFGAGSGSDLDLSLLVEDQLHLLVLQLADELLVLLELGPEPLPSDAHKSHRHNTAADGQGTASLHVQIHGA